MLARTSKIRHPSGLILETPFLVPSFSSKGSILNKVKPAPDAEGEDISEIDDAMKQCKELLTEPILVSAYDLHHKHFPSFEDIQTLPELVFIDSGGYETSSEFELSTVYNYPHSPKDWSEKELRETLDAWPAHVPAVFVNFDSEYPHKALPVQIATARRFFSRYPGHLHDILLKPEKKGKFLNTEPVLRDPTILAGFDMIGFTEKELGESLLDRLVKIASMRTALDAHDIQSPLHVFGGLDPLSSSLYFIAGAEVFDGLTWLRYSYGSGVAMYTFNYGAITFGVDHLDKSVKARSLNNNISCLQRLERAMRSYAATEDFSVFEDHADIIEDAYEALLENLAAQKVGGEA